MSEHAQLTVRDICGPYSQLLTNLQGANGQEWLDALKKFLRKEDSWADEKLSIPIRDMDFSVRTDNALRQFGVLSVRDLTQLSRTDLLRVPNFGRRCLNEVEGTLHKLRLDLKV